MPVGRDPHHPVRIRSGLPASGPSAFMRATAPLRSIVVARRLVRGGPDSVVSAAPSRRPQGARFRILPLLASCLPPWPPNWVHAYPAAVQWVSRAGVGTAPRKPPAGRNPRASPGTVTSRRLRRDRTAPGVKRRRPSSWRRTTLRLARAHGPVKATVAVEHGVIVAAWPRCSPPASSTAIPSDRRRGAGRWPRSGRRTTGPR